jgi:hypothetical protein
MEIYQGSQMCIPGLREAKKVDASSLDAIFKRDVLEDERWAWYVDYYTEDAAKFNVSYLTADQLVCWTNERLSDGSLWDADDVAKWFAAGSDSDSDKPTYYKHTVNFHADGKPHTLRLSTYNCTLDGRDVETEYIKDGVRGALGAFLTTFERLDSIIIHTL